MIEFFKKPMNKKGASSVLVILMMVVLALFGLSALTASLASVRLAEKSGDWSREFYALESEAEKRIADLDRILHEAEQSAVKYMEEAQFLKQKGTIMEDDIQKMASLNIGEYLPENAKANYLERFMKAVYMVKAIEGIAKAYPEIGIDSPVGIARRIIEDEAVSGTFVYFTVSEEGEGTNKNIDIRISVEFPGYSIVFAENGVSGTRTPGAARYNVVEWREWQESFSYGEDIQYADPVRD